MKASELFDRDYTEDLRSEIITLLTAASAQGYDEIDTHNLVLDLEEQGFAVDEESLLDILDELDVVSTATPEKITIATSDADAMVGDDARDIEADRVDNMAQSQATKNLGKDIGEDIARMRSLAGIRNG